MHTFHRGQISSPLITAVFLTGGAASGTAAAPSVRGPGGGPSITGPGGGEGGRRGPNLVSLRVGSPYGMCLGPKLLGSDSYSIGSGPRPMESSTKPMGPGPCRTGPGLNNMGSDPNIIGLRPSGFGGTNRDSGGPDSSSYMVVRLRTRGGVGRSGRKRERR